ncbi:MAG: GNAT family N-acetyltransferase, partial [Dysgonamonadaceae bacterium]|nr:GNAT family N-acetyltransferase [Dysgonamonadaceae bacterium]
IYSRPWWLDCVCGEKNWDVLLSLQDNAVVAAMPYYMPCSGIIIMPPFAQTMGIWFNPDFETDNYSRNLSRKQAVCEEFIQRLPDLSYFSQNFNFDFTDWLPFYWNGFRQTTRYTYILESIKNTEVLEKNLSIKKRQNIKKASEKSRLTVQKGISVDDFMKINAQTFERQGLKSYHPKKLKKLIETVRESNRGEIWGAYDEENRLHAAAFVVWQENCAYYISGGSDSQFLNTGALTFVVWNAICDVAEFSSSFDFEGSMLKGVENFFREFGAIQKPYFSIEKGKMTLWKKLKLRLSVSIS